MAMVHKMQIGAVEAIVLHEGGRDMPVNALGDRYPDADPAEIQAALNAINHSGETTPSQMNALYVASNDVRMLVDTGMGTDAQPAYGHLLVNLEAAGILPDEIDIVYLTHFHGDHIKGLLDEAGAPVFPDAHYVTHKREWAHWMSDDALAEMADDDPKKTALLPLKDKFVFADDGYTFMDGVTLVEAFGHTPGHSGLRILSEGESLLYLVDLLHHETQMLHPEWHFVYDTLPDIAEATRRAFLAQVATSGEQVMFYHLPFPSVGTVTALDDETYRWLPVS